MIHTVTLNPTLDLTYRIPAITFDDTVRAVEVMRNPGGKGINVSRVVKRLGYDTVALGFIGGHTGNEVVELLNQEDIRTWFTPINGVTRTNIIVQDEAGHQLRVSAPGPTCTAEDVGNLEESLFFLRPPKILVLSGTLLKGMDQDFYYRIILKMRESHVRVILDSDGEEFRRGLEARPYLIKPNSFELARLVGRQIHTDTEVAAAAHEVLERRVEVVLVSRGGRGAVLITKDLQLIAYPPKVKVDSAVGAGDSMLAGVAIKLTEGASLDEALRFGVACGTATVITPGTELCFPRDVLKFLPQVQVEEFRPA